MLISDYPELFKYTASLRLFSKATFRVLSNRKKGLIVSHSLMPFYHLVRYISLITGLSVNINVDNQNETLIGKLTVDINVVRDDSILFDKYI